MQIFTFLFIYFFLRDGCYFAFLCDLGISFSQIKGVSHDESRDDQGKKNKLKIRKLTQIAWCLRWLGMVSGSNVVVEWWTQGMMLVSVAEQTVPQHQTVSNQGQPSYCNKYTTTIMPISMWLLIN